MSDRYERWRFAQLVDTFHLTIDEIGELTELQLAAIYFHPRDTHGTLVKPLGTAAPPGGQSVPDDPKDLHEALQRLDAIHAAFRLANYEEARQALIEKYNGRSIRGH